MIEGLNKILGKLNSISNVDSVLLAKIGFEAELLIRDRTAKGVDVNGKAFKPYSSEYIRAISDGRKGVTKKQSKVVTLEATGNMLANITNKRERNSAVLFFSDSEQNDKAFKHHTGDGKMPQRKFFSLNKDDMTRINTIVANYYSNKIND